MLKVWFPDGFSGTAAVSCPGRTTYTPRAGRARTGERGKSSDSDVMSTEQRAWILEAWGNVKCKSQHLTMTKDDDDRVQIYTFLCLVANRQHFFWHFHEKADTFLLFLWLWFMFDLAYCHQKQLILMHKHPILFVNVYYQPRRVAKWH